MGVDWLGPIPTGNDDQVDVSQLPSSEERETLLQHFNIDATTSSTLSEESMLHSYAVSKHYVYHMVYCYMCMSTKCYG